MKCRLPTNSNHLDFVKLYLTDELMNLIVEETNQFANQFLQGENVDPENSYLRQWTPVTVAEMKKFIGILLFMGIIHKPNMYCMYCTYVLVNKYLLCYTHIFPEHEKGQIHVDIEVLSF